MGRLIIPQSVDLACHPKLSLGVFASTPENVNPYAAAASFSCSSSDLDDRYGASLSARRGEDMLANRHRMDS